jgi:hypothetical protein
VTGLDRAEWSGYSWMMVTTLAELGHDSANIRRLLDMADRRNDHPDWSEATNDEIAAHFTELDKEVAR